MMRMRWTRCSLRCRAGDGRTQLIPVDHAAAFSIVRVGDGEATSSSGISIQVAVVVGDFEEFTDGQNYAQTAKDSLESNNFRFDWVQN